VNNSKHFEGGKPIALVHMGAIVDHAGCTMRDEWDMQAQQTTCFEDDFMTRRYVSVRLTMSKGVPGLV
jgi:hypothetical protein